MEVISKRKGITRVGFLIELVIQYRVELVSLLAKRVEYVEDADVY